MPNKFFFKHKLCLYCNKTFIPKACTQKYCSEACKNEQRTCKCGCRGIFICRRDAKKLYILGHGRKNKLTSEIHKFKIGRANSIALRGKTYEEIYGSKERAEERKQKSRIKLKGKTYEEILGNKEIAKKLRGKRHKDAIKRCQNPEYIKKLIIAANKPERKEKLKKEMIERWRDPEYAQKIFRSGKKSPNKTEIFLDVIIQELIPNEYKFTGDGKFQIEGKYPDWTNVNGQKKLIEYYGGYHHADPNKYKANDIVIHGKTASEIWEHDAQRIEIFKNYGYSTLIIRTSELKDTDKLKKKILEFNQK